MKVTTIILLLTVGIVASANLSQNDQIFDTFKAFVNANKLNFPSTTEMDQRFTVFKENYQKVQSFTGSFSLKVNKFATMTQQEFRSTFLTLDINDVKLSFDWSQLDDVPSNTAAKKTTNTPTNNNNNNSNNNSGSIPKSFDWRSKNVVSSVKDQGSCGCCWAFSTIAILESAYAIKYGSSKLTSLSEQQLLSCDTSNSGCNGGNMMNALSYLKSAGGAVSRTSYPYKGAKSTCSKGTTVAKVGSYSQVNGDTTSMKTAIMNNGPLAIGIDAGNLQMYNSGIYSCKTANLDHAVTVVGWGSSTSGEYWIVKNSWGTDWGMSGYFYVAIGSCGTNQYAVSTTAA